MKFEIIYEPIYSNTRARSHTHTHTHTHTHIYIYIYIYIYEIWNDTQILRVAHSIFWIQRFFFFYIGCLTKLKELIYPVILHR